MFFTSCLNDICHGTAYVLVCTGTCIVAWGSGEVQTTYSGQFVLEIKKKKKKWWWWWWLGGGGGGGGGGGAGSAPGLQILPSMKDHCVGKGSSQLHHDITNTFLWSTIVQDKGCHSMVTVSA